MPHRRVSRLLFFRFALAREFSSFPSIDPGRRCLRISLAYGVRRWPASVAKENHSHRALPHRRAIATNQPPSRLLALSLSLSQWDESSSLFVSLGTAVLVRDLAQETFLKTAGPFTFRLVGRE